METPVRRIPALDVDCRITRTAPPTARPGVHASVLAECPAMHDLLAPLIHWYLEALDQGGYLLIGLPFVWLSRRLERIWGRGIL